jgi:4-hydroxythreonine-4-phosphate dehydrogenase
VVIARSAAIIGVDQSRLSELFEFIHVPVDGASDVRWGVVSGVAGAAAARWIEAAVDLCGSRRADAMATAPIQKESLWAAGVKHLGHTEMLAALTGSPNPQTMFEVRGLRIFFATRHMSLRAALEALTVDSQLSSIQSALKALQVLGVASPRLAVAAVNPHGGENGAFGREEIDIIDPAVEKAQALGLPVFGPVPADSVFAQALSGRYDAVLAQYHDQGHIAAKTVDFDGTVSVTMGLPIIRTSVDHGTAFDIAGKGVADPSSMVEAVVLAARLAAR